MNTAEIIPTATYINNDERLGEHGEFAGTDILKVVKMYAMEGEEIDVELVND
jgi:hypothetical protein